MKNKKVKKKPLKRLALDILSIIFFALVGGALGYYFLGYYLNGKFDSCPFQKDPFIIFFALSLLALYLAFFVQLIVHELGHLVFGLLTGYKFQSFRVGSLTWIKIKGKIEFTRYSLAGTGGQCLMSPPDLKDGKIPYVLYNLGGALFNFLFAILALIGSNFIKSNIYLYYLLGFAFVSGLYLALLNAIPIKKLANDGYNILEISRQSLAQKYYWVQLKVNELQTEGQRLKDMPEEYFKISSNLDKLDNYFLSSIAVFECDRFMDKNDFYKAEECITRLLKSKAKIHPTHKKLLNLDLIYCYLVNKSNLNKIPDIIDQDFQTFLKQMKKFPSVLRTQYAYALLAEDKPEKASKYYEDFKQISKSFPYLGTIESEEEKITHAKELYKERRIKAEN